MLEIGIIQHNCRGLPAQLKQHRLDILACSRTDDPANLRASGEADLPHERMRNKCCCHFCSIRSAMVQHIQTSSRETGFPEGITNSPVASW